MQEEEIIGIVAGVLTTFAVLPQIVRAVKTREVKDVSPYMFRGRTLDLLWLFKKRLANNNYERNILYIK